MSFNSQQQAALKVLGIDSTDPRATLVLALAGNIGAADGRVYNPSVERTGDKLVIPEGANLPDVISTLRRQYDREEQIVRVHVKMDVSPWDGAIALQKAIEQNLGVLIQKSCQCGDPNCGTHQMEVEVELGRTIQVPWGSFELPGMDDAEVTTETKTDNGQMVFACTVRCKRRYEDRVRRLLDTARQIASRESIHKGKAFSIAFHDDDGDRIPMPKPSFFQFMEEEPIFNQDLGESIERNVFVPLRHADDLRAMGQSLKRGILFAGDYGVGKTLLASHIAREAVKNGWTFIYVKDSEELANALVYAQKYQPVVVFAEDVDRVAGTERTDDVNDILNQLDGVDSKSAAIMTVLTTNHPKNINKAMRRPGRIDLVMEVLPPDAETVIRMINRFAGSSLKAGSDLTEVASILAGESPAKVRETIGRAKLETLRRAGSPLAKITSADLVTVAREVKAESGLFLTIEKSSDTHNVKAIADGFEVAASAMRRSVNGKGSSISA